MVVLAAAVQRVRKSGRQGDDFVALVVVGDHFDGSGHNGAALAGYAVLRSEAHTSELQSHYDLVCRLLLEKKKK